MVHSQHPVSVIPSKNMGSQSGSVNCGLAPLFSGVKSRLLLKTPPFEWKRNLCKRGSTMTNIVKTCGLG